MKKSISIAVFSSLICVAPFGHATDMGDLQKQVDELKRQVDSLQRGGSSEGGDWLNQDFVASGDVPVQVTLSGQINRAMLYTDDGNNTDYSSVDNDASSTRFGISGVADLNDALSMGAVWEAEYESNSTRAIHQFDREDAGNLNARKLEVFFDHAELGKLSLGQGRSASDTTSQNSFSGTKMVSYASSAEKMAGGFYFRDTLLSSDTFKANVNAGTGVQIDNVFDSMDGLGLDDRVRYDTVAYNGLSMSTSLMQRGKWDAALNYSCSCDDMSMKASLAYTDPDDPLVKHTINGSIAFIHQETGLNAAATYAKRFRSTTSAQRDDGKYMFGQLGIKQMLNEYGSTNFAVDYSRSEDMIADGGVGRSYGVGVVQEVEKIGAEIYLGWRHYTYSDDDNSTNFDDFNAMMLGARLAF